MDEDLERSIRHLEDSLSSPARSLLKIAKAKPEKKYDNPFHLTLTMAPDEIQKMIDLESVYQSENTSLISERGLVIDGSLIQTGPPWKNTMDNLYTEFSDILQTSTGGAEVLDVAADLARCCGDALNVIQSLKAKLSVSELNEENWLENERNNWRLLYVIYNDRFNSKNMEIDKDLVPFHNGQSEQLCVDSLFKSENLIRESQLVIDWLERNALEKDDPILHHSDWTYGWENTLHQLLAPDSIAIESNTEIITNIHPDAPQFQNKPLHHLDADNDRKLCKRIFMEIRCGKLEAAQELCYNCGHPWRAAMLEGWKLFHNANEELGENNNEYKDLEGNAIRDLWKDSALRFCKKNNVDIYEKAAVASLCGCLEAILPVCKNWEDYLWAYMRTMVDIRVESEIRDNIIKPYKSLPSEYWDQKLSLGEIFAVLEASKNQNVAKESQNIHHIIQKHIILDEIPPLIDLLLEWSEDSSTTTQSLRFFAHLILFLFDMGESYDRKKGEKIIEAYIKRLSEMNETQLVAFYVSKLSKKKQISIYAHHLEKIGETEDRKLALQYGEEYNLDIFAITQAVVECVCNRPTDIDPTGNLRRKITEADEEKISCLDWLIFYEQQSLEALKQTNALIFKFLTLGKLDAAQLAINKIPSTAVEKILSEGEVDADVDHVIKEHLSYNAYLDAQEAFNEWFKQYRNRPLPPQDLPETAQFTEKVVHQHRVAHFNAELERWKLTTSHSAKNAKTLLYNVLLFPQGWLRGSEQGDYLRSVCIPEIVLLLYSILSESGLHDEVVQLADLLASEKYGIYKVYSKDKLGEILEKISESSVTLLNTKKDPWGTPTA